MIAWLLVVSLFPAAFLAVYVGERITLHLMRHVSKTVGLLAIVPIWIAAISPLTILIRTDPSYKWFGFAAFAVGGFLGRLLLDRSRPKVS